MERAILVAVVLVAAALVAYVLNRRRPEPPTQARWAVPTQLDRADFARPGAPWLVAVFTSSSCDSCEAAMAKANVLASDAVVVEEIEVSAKPAIHQRYTIDAVPLIAVADADGVVRAAFVGVPSATDLWAAVAEARAPGSSPEPELGRLLPPN